MRSAIRTLLGTVVIGIVLTLATTLAAIGKYSPEFTHQYTFKVMDPLGDGDQFWVSVSTRWGVTWFNTSIPAWIPVGTPSHGLGKAQLHRSGTLSDLPGGAPEKSHLLWIRTLHSTEWDDTVTLQTMSIGWPLRVIRGHRAAIVHGNSWRVGRRGLTRSAKAAPTIEFHDAIPLGGAGGGTGPNTSLSSIPGTSPTPSTTIPFLPTHIILSGLFINTLCFALPIAMARSAFVYARRRIRSHYRHCPRCGYDLHAEPRLCPECGRPSTSTRPHRAAR